MAGYFFIQSLDAFTEKKTEEQFALMRDLADRNHKVEMLLVQDAVFMAARETKSPGLDGLMLRGVKVYADDFSLAQRGIDPAQLRPGLRAAAISCVIDAMLDRQKVIWN